MPVVNHELLGLSDLYLPWPLIAENPLAAVAIEATRGSATRAGLVDARFDLRRFYAFASSATYFYPSAGLEELIACSDWCAWLFFLDDSYDENIRASRDHAAARELMALCLDVLRGASPPVGAPPLARFTWEIRRRFVRLAPGREGWLRRFAASAQGYLYKGVLPPKALWGLGHDLAGERVGVAVPQPLQHQGDAVGDQRAGRQRRRGPARQGPDAAGAGLHPGGQLSGDRVLEAVHREGSPVTGKLAPCVPSTSMCIFPSQSGWRGASGRTGPRPSATSAARSSCRPPRSWPPATRGSTASACCSAGTRRRPPVARACRTTWSPRSSTASPAASSASRGSTRGRAPAPCAKCGAPTRSSV